MTSTTTFSRRHALLALGSLPLAARAQIDRPVRFILPISAGSGVDTIVRASSAALSKALGHIVVVENQPGAGGVVGTQTLIKAPPDGMTLSVVSNNHVIYPSVLKSLPFDPLNDITPIAVIGAGPLVLVVNPKLPAKDLKSFIALLKSSPGRYNFASSGNGTILHLAAEIFKDLSGTFSTHIPYRGFGPMMQDIVAGQVDWGVGALSAVASQVKAGNLRALCVPSLARSPAAPDIPTSAEAGLPFYVVEGWFGVVGPKGMPAEEVKRIHAAFSTAFATAEVKEAMAKQGNIIKISTPEAAKEFFGNELKRYARVVKRAGVQPQ
ncbi:Bug family tripartite tricarboxylate transporter substrate binding protein [Variovorax sp. MHTC-1]|uniref:Bug family tripartite tricarboxylate transporter substrate binding protein n=1 Tax=Variovorax sp. MHTC-1 TaxID=2495593 RepID=UPI000F85CAFE|nr:tripartite tricarboxylate transporter substrate-binding protein [Variovorax sp. MHTC-1]RST48109.1 tripartite tricarboxylate transporter substrate binding protein [Variovorax sp. MHTC-1]